MKCPLILSAMEIKGGLYDAHTNECLKERCAWWTDGEEGCVIPFIEKDLAGIWTMLTEIVNKMPHEKQFRR